MNDGSRTSPEFYTGKPDFSDVKALIEQASAEALPVDNQDPQDPLKLTYDEADIPVSLGRTAATGSVPTSPFLIPEAKAELSELARIIREINTMGIMLDRCRNKEVDKSRGDNV